MDSVCSLSEDPRPTHINISIRSQDGKTIGYKVKRFTELGKLMKLYCERQSLELGTIAFLFNGSYIKQSSTPDQLHMEDGDELDAMLHQTSG
ncbi:hypothetical protein ACHQM5_021150 [Ranunculus cassubicifolius]